MDLFEFDVLDSTNSYLCQNWAALAHFSFVRAQLQTKGKGRGERVWSAKKGQNLTFSLLLRKKAVLSEVGPLSLGAAVAVGRTLEKHGIHDVEIKWPNDVYVSGKKICGILLEGQIPTYCVVGIGLNVNQTFFEGTYRKEPTSMALCLGREIDIDALYADLREELCSIYGTMALKPLLSYYRAHDYLKGRKVYFVPLTENKLGDVLGVDEHFSLIVECEGKAYRLTGGEPVEGPYYTSA